MTSWVTLTDARQFLRFQAGVTEDDAQLQTVIDGACAAIEDIKGAVAETLIADEVCRVIGGRVWLATYPVVSVDAVSWIRGDGTAAAVVKAQPSNGMTGFELLSAGGVVSVPGTCGRVLATYTAGRNPIPANFVLAAKELVAHLWRTSQLNPTSANQAGGGDTEWIRGASGASYALPFKVRELLGIFGGVVKPVLVR